MQKEKIMDMVREQNGGLVNFILTTLEAALGEESRKQQLQSIRKLILDKHNQNLRDLELRVERI